MAAYDGGGAPVAPSTGDRPLSPVGGGDRPPLFFLQGLRCKFGEKKLHFGPVALWEGDRGIFLKFSKTDIYFWNFNFFLNIKKKKPLQQGTQLWVCPAALTGGLLPHDTRVASLTARAFQLPDGPFGPSKMDGAWRKSPPRTATLHPSKKECTSKISMSQIISILNKYLFTKHINIYIAK